MINLLQKFEFLQLLVLLLIIISTLLLVIFFGKPYIRIGDTFVFGLGTSEKNKKLPHDKCPFKIDFKTTMVKTLETMSKYDSIKYHETLNIQMSIVEEQLVIIRSKLLNKYSSLLMKHTKNHKNITSHADYKSYAVLVDLFLCRDLKPVMLTAFKQNNITKMGKNDFNEYVQQKALIIYEMGTLFFDNNYGSHKMEVSRDDIKNSNLKIKSEYLQIIQVIFKKGQEIAIQADKKLEKELEKLYEFYEDIVGLDLNDEKEEIKKEDIIG